ncbi:MAG: carbohydrate ABC transporter permease, partial [Pseudomonadota bacterium]
MVTRSLSNIVLFLIVFIWVVPFVALVTTSLRSEVASKTSGFWTSYSQTELGHRFRTHEAVDEPFTVMEGNIFDRLNVDREDFEISGDVQSIMFVGRVPDPNDDSKTILIRELIAVGEV